jgi:hypothetical protein
MLAIHDQFAHKMCESFKTTCMGWGLMRLLQDAKRFDEARTTLSLLENGFQGVAEKSDKPSPKPCKVNRLKGVNTTASRSSESASIRIAEAKKLTQPSSIA